jgi:hypothetical protein
LVANEEYEIVRELTNAYDAQLEERVYLVRLSGTSNVPSRMLESELVSGDAVPTATLDVTREVAPGIPSLNICYTVAGDGTTVYWTEETLADGSIQVGPLATSPDIKSVLNGSGAPASATGENGDFYIDTTNWQIYGPKDGGAWGSGTDLVGADGAQGPGFSVSQPSGADYTGAADSQSSIAAAITAYGTNTEDEHFVLLDGGELRIDSGLSATGYYGFTMVGAGNRGLTRYGTDAHRTTIAAGGSFTGDLFTLSTISGYVARVTFAGADPSAAQGINYDGLADRGIAFESDTGFGAGQMLWDQVGIQKCTIGFDAGADGATNNASDQTFNSCTWTMCEQAFHTSHDQALNYLFLRPQINFCKYAYHFEYGGSAHMVLQHTYDTECLLYMDAPGSNGGWIVFDNCRIDSHGDNENDTGVRTELLEVGDVSGFGAATKAAFLYTTQITDCPPTYELEFDTGTTEIVRGDFITDAASGETAKGCVLEVTVDSGTWGGGDAAGTIKYSARRGTQWSNNDGIYVGGSQYALAAADTSDALGRIRVRGNSLVEVHGGYNLHGDRGDTFDADSAAMDQGPLIDFMDDGTIDSIVKITWTALPDGLDGDIVGYDTSDYDGWWVVDFCYDPTGASNPVKNKPIRRWSNHPAWQMPNAEDLGTKGDLLVGSGDSDAPFHTLAATTNGYVLTLDSAEDGGMKWAAASGGASALDDLTDVTITSVGSGEVLGHNGFGWINRTLVEAGIAAASHTHAASDVTSGTFDDGRVAESNVTQHEAALTITESQISDLGAYLTDISGEQLNDLSGVVISGAAANDVLAYNNIDGEWQNTALSTTYIQSGTFDDARIAESNVTQHEAALSITESQISDLGSYLTAETNDLTAAVTWADVPDGNITESSVTQHEAALTITESQISDLGTYLTDITGEQLGDLSGVTISGATTYDVLAYNLIGGYWENTALSTSYIQSGTFADARIAESNVTQHEAALSITESQISDLGTYIDADGTVGLSADWDAGSHKITAEQLESDVTTGTAPLVVASTTLVDNLNPEYWGGKKHYGSLATTSQPSGAGVNDGDEYYDTTVSRTCVYNGVKDKWFIKGGSGQVNFNYNGNCAAGSYLRGYGGMPLVSARGTPVPKCTVVALYYSQSSSSASTLNFKQGSTAFSWSVPAANFETFDYTLNEDLSADNLSPENDSGGATISNVQLTLYYELRP